MVAIGPFSPIELQLSPPSSAGTSPNPGLMPTRPHAAAGTRIEPRPSLPCASGTRAAATAAALPPDDPPQVRDRSQGLRAIPNPPSVNAQIASSGIRVTPTTTAPAARSRATTR